MRCMVWPMNRDGYWLGIKKIGSEECLQRCRRSANGDAGGGDGAHICLTGEWNVLEASKQRYQQLYSRTYVFVVKALEN